MEPYAQLLATRSAVGMNINELELTIRASNILNDAGIKTVEQLVSLDWGELNSIKGCGDKSVSEIAWNCVMVLNGRFAEQIQAINDSNDRSTGETFTRLLKMRDEIQAVVNDPKLRTTHYGRY